MNSLVSVIIPVYNVKPYLREALDSVIGQTYRNLEIIIVDDGSIDGSGPICDEYTSDSRVTVIHQNNKGLSGARNAGLDIIKGEFVCFLDPDDAYHPAFIEKTLDEAQSIGAEMVVCKFTMQKTPSELASKGENLTPKWPHLASGIYNRVNALRSLVEGELDVSVWNKLYKCEIWSSIRFPEGRNFEDIDTMYRIVDSSKTISVIDDVLLFKRDRADSITHNYSLKNVHDLMLACSNLDTLIQSQSQGLFSDALIARYKQRTLNSYMDIFANCYHDRKLRDEIREKIIENGKKIEHWNVRTKVAYLIVCHFPSLFRFAYKIYRTCMLIVRKVTIR